MAALGQATPQRAKMVAAERFVLRDASGHEFGALEAPLGSGPRLALHTADDASEATLAVEGLGGVRLRLASDHESVVGELGVLGLTPSGELVFRGRSREGRLELLFQPREELQVAALTFSPSGCARSDSRPRHLDPPRG